MTSKTFTDFPIDSRLTDALASQGIVTPFPIQELTLPMALKGHDIIGQARTGTGKTLAFGLPLLQQLDPELNATQALVVVPTRELCLQVAGDLRIGKERGLTLQTVYGGVGYDEQIDALTGNVHIVVGTPGRLLDHLNRGNLDLSQVRVLVLDEADEMLDMGFLPDVERLITACASDERHTMLFSATMPSAVVKLARRYMSSPTFLRADVEEHETSPDVDQHFLLVHRMDKPRVLARILQSPGRGSVYVFTRTKRMADRLVNELEDLGTASIAVHGDLRQGTREKNMGTFRDGTIDVLVATEVAARGLDVENATHVINYDCPDDEKMYLHRIGRTARAGAKGVAVTFAEFNEADRLNVIRKAVDADRQIAQVFSTSDELREWFDLPAQTPWEHLGTAGDSGGKDRKPRTGSRSGSSEKASRSGGSKGSGRSERSSRSDGRSKNRATRESGASRDTSKRTTRAKPTSPPAASTDTGATAAAPPALGERDDAAETVRTRTRSRPSGSDSGSTSSSKPSADSRSKSSADSRSKSSSGSGSSSGSSSSGGRTRARARTSSATSSSDRTRARTSRASDTQDEAKEQSGSGAGTRDTQDRGSSSTRSNRSSQRNGSRRDDHRGNERDEPRPTTDEPTPAGPQARGDGKPQLARRVKVEHLP